MQQHHSPVTPRRPAEHTHIGLWICTQPMNCKRFIASPWPDSVSMVSIFCLWVLPHTCFVRKCVWLCVGLCVSCRELRFTAINHCVNPRLPRSVKATPGYGLSLSCARVSLRTVSPFRGSEGITCVHSSIVIFFFLFFLSLPLSSFLHLFSSLPILSSLSKTSRMFFVKTNSFHAFH